MLDIPDFWSILAQALGWTLLHSIWQISLVFLVFKTFSWVYERYNRVGYVCALIAMSFASIWSCITFSSEYRRAESLRVLQNEARITVSLPESMPEEPSVNLLSTPSSPAETSLKDAFINWLGKQSAWLGGIWFLGVVVLFLRMVGGYWLTERLRRRGVSVPEQQFSEMCRQWADRLGVWRNVQLLESKYVTQPLTLGFWKPVILFPAGMLLHLPTVQVETLLLHELAHVRRYDYLVNMFQLILDTLFFYHPLFWLLSGEARRRREYCCDDTVLHYTRRNLEYARALTEIRLNPFHTQNPFAMNALEKDHFSIRILRIAGISVQRSNRSTFLLPLILLVGMITVLCIPLMTKAAAPNALSGAAPFPTEPVSGPGASSSSTQNDFHVQQPNRSGMEAVDQPAAENTVPAPAPVSPDTSSPAASVAIELNKMNVCYIGIDNPLQIAVDGVPASQISVRIKGEGSISGSNGQYIARFSQPGPAQIEVYRRRGDSEVLLASKGYRIKRIPDPIPVWGGIRGGRVSLDELLKYKEMTALLANFDFDAVCNVVGFEFTILPAGAKSDVTNELLQDITTVVVQGNVLPKEQVDSMKKLTSGAAVFFDDIKVKCPGDGVARNIGGLSFKIK